MAFGLPQWLISFAIFLIILTIITWSAVHLGRKEQNSTNIILRFLDVDDYSIKWKNTSLHFAIISNSTSRMVESTIDPTLFANDQDSEIPDSMQFHKILQTFYATEGNAINSTNYEIITAFVPSVIGNDSMWNNDTDKAFVDDHRNVSGKVTILSNHILQTVRSTLTPDAKLFDVNKLWKLDLNQSTETQSEFFGNVKNETSDTFVIFPFTQALPDAIKKQLNMTKRTKTIRTVM